MVKTRPQHQQLHGTEAAGTSRPGCKNFCQNIFREVAVSFSNIWENFSNCAFNLLQNQCKASRDIKLHLGCSLILRRSQDY